MSKSIILIPARYGSVRFPGKPLAKILNKQMIQYVIENCEQSDYDYSVVTDNDEIEQAVKSIGANVVRVDDDVSTGSERIALAFERFFKNKGYEFVINVQGDEPLLKSNLINQIGKAHEGSNFDVYTAVKRRKSHETEHFLNSNVVKCVFSAIDSKCLYFSRSPIPFSREDASEHDWFQHIGVYSYRVSALEKFVSLKESHLESLEKLEQLRLLENSMSIGASIFDVELLGVDSPEDIVKIERVLSE